MEIPEWAIYKEKATVKDTVLSLVSKLPIDYEFFTAIVHKKLVTIEGFKLTNVRRTREALQVLAEQGILTQTRTTKVDGRMVKMYVRSK